MHLTYHHRNDISALNSLGLSWRALSTQCYAAEDRQAKRRNKKVAYELNNRAKNKRLAEFIKKPYFGWQKEEADIDRKSIGDLRDQ